MDILYEDDKIKLIKRDKQYYLIFDTLEYVKKIIELELAEQDALRILENADYAYDLVVDYLRAHI